MKPLLLGEREPLGTRAENSHALGFRHVPEDRLSREQWGAVVEDDRRADGERGDQPIPHHPAAGGEEERAIVPTEVAM